MGNMIQGDVVHHERFGIGRVEETSGAGDDQQCTVHFSRTNGRTVVAAEELMVLTDAEMAAYDMVKLAVVEVSRDEMPQTELGARWQGGEMVLKPGDPKLASKSVPIEML